MKKSQPILKSRRGFLSDCGKMTAIGSMSSILNMTMTNKVLAARSPGSITDYKATVCVFLSGGMDSFQMLMPGSGTAFDNYTERRGSLALDRFKQHSVRDVKGREYHVNESMPEVANMFTNGDISFITNVGTLVEPLNKTEFQNGSKQTPRGLASHNDQISEWQTSLPNEKGGTVGWFGRMADVINDAANNNSTLSMNLAPGGANILQQGREISPFTVQGGANALELYDQQNHIRQAVDTQLEYDYASLLHQHYNHVKKSTIEQNQELQSLERNTTIQTKFPSTALGVQLLQVAKYIKVHGVLGLNRQTFYVGMGGWDMHSGLNDRIGGNLAQVSQALNAFNNAMKEIGEHNNVTTYTASDFGRSLGANGSGSDHAWGGNQIVMGGALKGNWVLGAGYPDLSEGSATDLNVRGRQLPTTSIDQLHATIARWFGINNDSELETILPNIRNFYSSGISDHPLNNMFS